MFKGFLTDNFKHFSNSLIVVCSLRRLIMAVVAKFYFQPVFFAVITVKPAKYMVPFRCYTAAKKASLAVQLNYAFDYFHAPNICVNSCGVMVSMPTALQSCTTASIKRIICSVSYVDEP